MIIKVQKEDVFDYVTSQSPYDAIEKCMDAGQRQVFELMNQFAYHLGTREKYPQSETYVKYMEEVSKLKATYERDGMSCSETFAICEEIAEIAPEHINLEFPEEENS